MSEEEWTEVNTLLMDLRHFKVVELVREYYAKYENDAPPVCLSNQINKVQGLLSRSKQ